MKFRQFGSVSSNMKVRGIVAKTFGAKAGAYSPSKDIFLYTYLPIVINNK